MEAPFELASLGRAGALLRLLSYSTPSLVPGRSHSKTVLTYRRKTVCHMFHWYHKNGLCLLVPSQNHTNNRGQ